VKPDRDAPAAEIDDTGWRVARLGALLHDLTHSLASWSATIRIDRGLSVFSSKGRSSRFSKNGFQRVHPKSRTSLTFSSRCSMRGGRRWPRRRKWTMKKFK
jgi:hypothetical protein